MTKPKVTISKPKAEAKPTTPPPKATAETSSHGDFDYSAYVKSLVDETAPQGGAGPIGDDGSAPIGGQDSTGRPLPPPGAMPDEAFWHLFSGAFRMGHHATKLQSLDVEGLKEARAASDALYDICCDVPSLQWLILPQSIWMQRLTTIAMFAVPVALGCRAEIAERRAALAAPEAGSEPAGEPAPEAAPERKPQRHEDPLMKEFENATAA